MEGEELSSVLRHRLTVVFVMEAVVATAVELIMLLIRLEAELQAVAAAKLAYPYPAQ